MRRGAVSQAPASSHWTATSQQLGDLGYQGYVGLEYKATRPDTFDWLPPTDRGLTAESLSSHAETRIQ